LVAAHYMIVECVAMSLRSSNSFAGSNPETSRCAMSALREATVDPKHLRIHPPTIGTGQEGYRIADVFRSSHALQRSHLRELIDNLL